jgi:anti-sigma regulatory factor (Ser/Thr protein kinase)
MPDPATVLAGRSQHDDGVAWFALRHGDPESVSRARDFVAAMVNRYGFSGDHVHTIRWAASEALANAVAAADDWAKTNTIDYGSFVMPVQIGVTGTARWTRIDVRDPDPVIPERRPHDLMDTRGRGFAILDVLAARWWWSATHVDKILRVLIAAPGVTLTADEIDAAVPQ